LDQVQREAIRRSHNGTRARLFLRRPMDRTRTMQAGDVVMVETLNSKTSNTSTKFIGLCLGVFRRGVDTSFTLRNIVMKLGVEINFKGYSPMIKDIKILEKGSGYNRAKLFYIRKQPEKAFMFNNRKEMRVSNK
ncbi:translation protein SH3-like domain-containing protein, partial [Dimargaris cristalligena]